MTYSVAVSGVSGYAGGEVLRLLSAHPHVSIGAVTAHSSAGTALGVLQPHLHGLRDRQVEKTTAKNLRGHDVVFLALPHGASAEIVAELASDTVVIDAGADFRLRDAGVWQEFYGSPHAGTWPYGLPELPGFRDLLKNERRIAVPGCFPTGALLALAPGFAAGLLEPEDVVVVSASGASGAGRAAKQHLLGAETMGGMTPYGVGGGHRHTPEIEQGLSAVAGEPVTLSFTPTLAPMARGILTTATARVKPGVTAERLRRTWCETYGAEEFVTVLPEGQWPGTKSVLGSNHVVVQLAFDAHAGRVVVCSVVDNLTKGTAGGAVQCMNLVLGLPESTGLSHAGVAP